ncbi:MAG: N-6 DNA methylase [Chloroflexota bacterium]
MHEYLKYKRHLDDLITRILKQPGNLNDFDSALSLALNGQPSDELRKAVAVNKQREAGAFFTHQELASIALTPLRDSLTKDSVIADISCGTGDLLFPLISDNYKKSSVSELLLNWNRRLIGHDIHPEFIAVAKRRLLLSAIQQAQRIDISNDIKIDNFFPLLSVNDGLQQHNTIQNATHIVLNPPFTRVQSPLNCSWANGKVNLAAIFMDVCVSNAKPQTRIVAILPDVLRSGSLYKKWRRRIESRTLEVRSELYGQFDKWADVHVFVLELVVNNDVDVRDNYRWNQICEIPSRRQLKDHFEVRVGGVVDYRDPHEGNLYPFVTPADLPAWGTLTNIDTNRKFSGRVFSPPFVAVRRTSRQEDKNRAVPTIVDCDAPVAVENHLLVLLPFSKSIEDCRKLVKNLQDQRTNDWLNQIIRCRHLTVSALKQLPWWQEP